MVVDVEEAITLNEKAEADCIYQERGKSGGMEGRATRLRLG